MGWPSVGDETEPEAKRKDCESGMNSVANGYIILDIADTYDRSPG